VTASKLQIILKVYTAYGWMNNCEGTNNSFQIYCSKLLLIKHQFIRCCDMH